MQHLIKKDRVQHAIEDDDEDELVVLTVSP